jgi:hypothetical protein
MPLLSSDGARSSPSHHILSNQRAPRFALSWPHGRPSVTGQPGTSIIKKRKT